MADELIRLDKAIVGIDVLITKAETAAEANGLFKAKDVIYSQQRYFADVQPVDRWISVKDRLPDKFEYVLCYCKTTTGEGNEFMFGAYHNDTWWLKTCRTYATLEQPQMRVMYWTPLPKPPKDGDTE